MTSLIRLIHTWNTFVTDFQVGLEVFRTRIGSIQHSIGNTDLTRRTAGALSVHVYEYVGMATNVTIVTDDASTKFHATIEGSANYDDV